MDTLNPYMMPSYYWYDPMNLAPGMQMMNMMEQDTMSWEPCDKLSDSECDACVDVTKDDTGQSKLNPAAPDFNPENFNLSDQNNWLCDIQPSTTKQESDFECVINVGNDQLKMSAVSMDLVIAANYILNDVFSFITPEAPMIELPHSEVDKSFHPSKKNKSVKFDKSISPYYGRVMLVKPEISYGKEQLMAIAKSPLCQVTPQAWPMIAKKLPRLVRREGPTAKIIIKEVRAIKKQEEEQNNTSKEHNSGSK